MNKCCILNLPEQTEGKEGGYVCLILTDDIDRVQTEVKEKQLGVQGSDWGVEVKIVDYPYQGHYSGLELSIDQLKESIKGRELNYSLVMG